MKCVICGTTITNKGYKIGEDMYICTECKDIMDELDNQDISLPLNTTESEDIQ